MFDMQMVQARRKIALWIQSAMAFFDKKRELAAAIQARDFIIDGLERQIEAQAKTSEYLTEQLNDVRRKLREVLAEHSERAIHNLCGGQIVIRAGLHFCIVCQESRENLEEFPTVTVNGSKGVKLYSTLLEMQKMMQQMSFYKEGKTLPGYSEKAGFASIVDILDKIGVNHVNNLDAR
jgi:hypothetical protein